MNEKSFNPPNKTIHLFSLGGYMPRWRSVSSCENKTRNTWIKYAERGECVVAFHPNEQSAIEAERFSESVERLAEKHYCSDLTHPPLQ